MIVQKDLTVEGTLKAPLLEVEEIQYVYQKKTLIDDGDLDISGNLDISNNLDVSGYSVFHNDVSFNGKAYFHEDISFSSQADVSFNGKTYFHEDVSFSSQADVSFNGLVDFNNDVSFSSQADVSFNGKTYFHEDVSFSSQADVSFNGKAYFNNDASFNSKAHFSNIYVDVSTCNATGSEIYPLHVKGDTGSGCAQVYFQDSSHGLRVETNNSNDDKSYIVNFLNDSSAGLVIYNKPRADFNTDVSFNSNYDVSFNGKAYFYEDVSFSSQSDVSFNGSVDFNLGITAPTTVVALKGTTGTDLSSSNGGIGSTYYDLSSVVFMLKKIGLLDE